MGFDLAETDRLLTTTRSVRRRLDRTRPVDIDLLKRCLEIAVQAPTGSKLEDWRWLVVTDPVQRQRIGEVYADASMRYLEWWRFGEPDLDESSPAVVSARVLWEHLDEVPALMFRAFSGTAGTVRIRIVRSSRRACMARSSPLCGASSSPVTPVVLARA